MHMHAGLVRAQMNADNGSEGSGSHLRAPGSPSSPRSTGQDQLRAARSYRQKAEVLARFKGGNARSASFFGCALEWHLQTTLPLEKIAPRSWWSCSAAQRLRAASGSRGGKVGGGRQGFVAEAGASRKSVGSWELFVGT
jgi:hypothetical protein